MTPLEAILAGLGPGMDVLTAIEGPEQAFRCTEIRKNGVGAAIPE